MPVLELGNDLAGNMPRLQCEIDALKVWTVMVYPDDIEKRTELFAVVYGDFLLNLFTDEAIQQPTVTVPAAVMECLLRARPADEVHAATAKYQIRGCHAGQVLWHVLAMQLLEVAEPSVGKALWLIERFNAERTQQGDVGKRALPCTEQSLRKCWEGFKPVAHFWAAFEMRQGWLGLASHQEAIGESEPPHYKANIMARHFFGCSVREFVNLAETLRVYGEAFRSERAKGHPPLLPPEPMWRVPADYLPALADDEMEAIPIDLDPDYAGWIHRTLADYSVRDAIRNQA